jgi:predicted AlkP superfamily phosphohydrolase/phosphomutase
MQVPFEIRLGKNGREIPELILDKDTYSLPKGEYTPWVRINFRPGLGMKVRGLCRFMLLETSPHVRLYVTPIQIDPERPALPISYPTAFSIYLAKMQGPFATLGVAEDTSGLNEHIIDEDAFLKQCYSIHDERETMFFDVLEKTRRGLLVCVFDITDRLQHMFFRYLEDNHPASKGKDVDQYAQEIRSLYIKMDDLVGRVLEKMDDDTVLIVLSDHGCKSFRREVNLNAWLKQNGYLVVKENASGGDMLQDIDWSKSKAYAVGFGGIYLNLAGREAQGIVKSSAEAEELKKEITEKPYALFDEEENANPVKQIYDRYDVYSGPYVQDAPDLVVGFRIGYRVAWDSVTGGVGDQIIKDNERPWSGDHNMNPPDVPGMLFCNRPVAKNKPHIEDIAPSVLDLFGVPIPAYYDGKSFFPVDSETWNEERENDL